MSLAFDGATKRITLSSGTVSLAVRDLWSRACDWMAEGDNSKWGDICTQVGGDIIQIPIYLFLAPGWKIVPQSADHTLTVGDGVLYSSDGSDPFVDPVGSYKIRINRETPGIAIGYSSTGGTAPSAGDVADAVWSHSSATTMAIRLTEAWGRLGLDPSKPLISGQTEISFGAIVMALTGNETSSTLTRAP